MCSGTKRLYYFTGPEHALENVEMRRLKLSFPDKVNDIFEMMPFDFGKDKASRKAWKKAISEVSQISGFISFSSEWNGPSMWGHYAQYHKGACLGFEVAREIVTKIKYKKKFEKFNYEFFKSSGQLLDKVSYAQKTKSVHWKYEKEWRLYIGLTTEEKEQKRNGTALFFRSFNQQLALREVIIGADSPLTSQQFQKALIGYDQVEVKTARPSFRGFKIVEQQSTRLQK